MKIDGGMSVNGMDLSSMDIETALLAVQSQRTQLLDSQLADQIKAVQARNDQIANLNSVLGELTKVQGKFPQDSATATIKDWNDDKIQNIEIPFNDAIQKAGITDLGFTARQGRISTDSTHSKSDGHPGHVLPAATNIFQAGTTKGEVDAAITKIKGMIDTQTNSQQMDMLRLQSLSNKRNESFDVMTNFVKKMQDSRSSIIGNMR
jgi:hypothetical protein